MIARLKFVWRWLAWFFKGPGFDYTQGLDDNTRRLLNQRWMDRMPRRKP